MSQFSGSHLLTVFFMPAIDRIKSVTNGVNEQSTMETTTTAVRADAHHLHPAACWPQ